MNTLENTAKNKQARTVDPVCGMEVEPGRTKLVSVHKGHSYWFCAESCRRAFEADPEKYLDPKPAKKKGWFGRYLERMARINAKELGDSGAKCH